MGPGLWPIRVEPVQIGQVLGNLVRNARQAMPSGGTLTVKLHNRELTVASGVPVKPGRYVVADLIDTGHGIDAADLPLVFDPFFSTRRGASGLGLSTSLTVLREHGGHLTLHSVLGEGTRVELLLPASTPEDESR